jgi:hypothetical protein
VWFWIAAAFFHVLVIAGTARLARALRNTPPAPVDADHAALHVESRKGRGSQFRVWLPLAQRGEGERGQGAGLSQDAREEELV